MQPFLHGRLQQLEALIARSSAAFALYNRLDLGLHSSLNELLDAAADYYRAHGRSGEENQLLALKAELVAAAESINPLTLERVTGRRRELRRLISLRALQQSALLLRADLDKLVQSLTDAEAQLRRLLLIAAGKGLIPAQGLGSNNQAAIDALWHAILADADLTVPARQLAMQYSVADLQLLIAELVPRLLSPAPSPIHSV